jgi:hypothetical protein
MAATDNAPARTAPPGVLPNYDIGSILTPEDGLEAIRQNLVLLKGIAQRTDFGRADHKANFDKNLSFIKQYYERVDYLLALRGE